MTDSDLLELAKLGDPQAIAALMNQSLQSRGMNATVDRQGDCLEVTLEAERVPNRQALTAFVQQGINNLSIQSIRSIRIVGQQVGASYPAWMQEIELGVTGNTLDELSNLAANDLAVTTPLNIQPETEPEITAIPSNDEAEPNWSAVEMESLGLDLSEPSPDQDSDVWSDADAPDFLQELLADADRTEPSLFAESPDGTLNTLDPEMDLFFEDLEQAAQPRAADPLADLLSSESADSTDLESPADIPADIDELDADLLDFLGQPDETPPGSEAESDFTIDALLDPAAEMALDAELTADDLPPVASNSLLASQIEDLFDAEIDQPGGGFIEEILPERPAEDAEDLRQALISEEPIGEPAPEVPEDPWTVNVLPELSEARTVLDLDDDDLPPNGELPNFMTEPTPDSPDTPLDFSAAQFDQETADSVYPDSANADLDALFAESEEPPISVAEPDFNFYGSIADEELAEEDIEELPPDFLQDFSDEFPIGFVDDFTEAEAPFPEATPIPSDAVTTLPEATSPEAELPPTADLEQPELDNENFTLEDNWAAAPAEPPLAPGDLAAELDALSLANSDFTFVDSTPTDFVASDSGLALTLDQPIEPAPTADVADAGLDADLDADLADLLSETPQGTAIESGAPAELAPPPQPEDFFAEPIAPIIVPSDAEVGSATPPAEPPEPLPEVSQDALEAGLGDFREGFVEPLPEEFFVEQPHPAETEWQADLRDSDLTDDSEANYIIEDSTPAVVYTPLPLPTSEKAEPTSPERERGTPPWLFPFVLCLVGGWIAGLLGFALFWSRVAPPPSPPPAGESPVPSPEPSAPSAPVPASPTSQQPTGANLAQATSLKSAVEQASDAVALTQAAQSIDDWGLAASKWQQAINLLKTVPSNSPDYATAQQKLIEYESNLATARRKANLPIVAAAPLGAANVKAQSPSPDASPDASPSAASVVCNAVPSAPNSQPVELSSVQFDPTLDQAQASPIVGCITNHTEQPIATVNVAYKNSDSNAVETEATGDLTFDTLDPKQTVPFKSRFTVTSQVKNLTIASISWTATGTTEAKQLPATINITRGNQDG